MSSPIDITALKAKPIAKLPAIKQKKSKLAKASSANILAKKS